MKSAAFLSASVVVFSATMLMAQDVPAMPAPQKEHEWLMQFVGEWESDSKATIVPGQPAMECQGTMKCRSLGGFWVVSDVKSEMMGVPVTALQTLGYDAESKKYIGTWIDSMMGYMWKYEGSVDETGKILTLEAEGPNFLADGKTAKFRDVYEFKSKDHVAVSGSMQGEDGKWVTFMTGDSRRKK